MTQVLGPLWGQWLKKGTVSVLQALQPTLWGGQDVLVFVINFFSQGECPIAAGTAVTHKTEVFSVLKELGIDRDKAWWKGSTVVLS